jgi:uronate dehydrogenase
MQIVSVRIGSFGVAPQDGRQLSTWLSPGDCLAAFVAAMTAPTLTYSTIYGVSRNKRRWWDLAAGQALGYEPRDDAEQYAADVPRGEPSPGGPQGGCFASPAYTLDRQRQNHKQGP